MTAQCLRPVRATSWNNVMAWWSYIQFTYLMWEYTTFLHCSNGQKARNNTFYNLYSMSVTQRDFKSLFLNFPGCVLLCSIVYYTILYYNIRYTVLSCTIVLYCTTQYYIYYRVLYCTILHFTAYFQYLTLGLPLPPPPPPPLCINRTLKSGPRRWSITSPAVVNSPVTAPFPSMPGRSGAWSPVWRRSLPLMILANLPPPHCSSPCGPTTEEETL